METGISTACLYPMETERALDLLLGLGFRRFEVFLNCESELQRPFLRELKARADEYGAVFTSVHPFTSAMESSLLFGNYPRRRPSPFTGGIARPRPTWAGSMWSSTASPWATGP